ncbi:(2Fe-2S) ferredoxin domain-containing protein [Pedobacter aquae]|uniref:(2Fe-2S) ferredoxin domain-containing protein n=1 Tax=Pedobacter aquae TaxID=2605747 RepID=A0A5C0VK69_9SPHI|nr:(2Fe-2S) ferredoxin domain-containing protein [Pedobacter aquae]QEK52081.1 (2Fe-2S) ferredoxin domain-containing protein [Pedobacter aquae]
MSKFYEPENIIYVCTGSKCAKKGGKDCYKSLKSYVKHTDTEVIRIECTDRCKFAPVLNLQPQNIWLKEYTEKQVFKTLEELKLKKR